MTFTIHSRTWLQGSLCTLANTAFVELLMHPLLESIKDNTNVFKQSRYHHYNNVSSWLQYVSKHYGVQVNSTCKLLLNKEEISMNRRSFISINAGNKHAAFLTNQTELIIIGTVQEALSLESSENNFFDKSEEKGNQIYSLLEKYTITPWQHRSKRNCTISSSVSFNDALLRWYNVARHRQVCHFNKSYLKYSKEFEVKNVIEGEGICNQREDDTSNTCTPHLIDLSSIFDKNCTTSCKVVCGCNSTVVYQPNTCLAVIIGANCSNYIREGYEFRSINNIVYKRIPVEEIVTHKELTECEIKREEQMLFASHERELSQSKGVMSSINGNQKIKEIICGFNHMFIVLTSSKIFACGSNTYGELAIGTLSSPSSPKEITFFEELNMKVKKIAAGNSFSLFLTEDGRVYGSGSCQHGQLTMQSENPACVPLLRGYVNENINEELQFLLNNQHKTNKTYLNKLIKIKDIGCIGTIAVYVSVKNEILLQGSWEEFGFCVRSPRIYKVDQSKIKLAYRKWILSHNEDVVETSNDFNIVEMFTGPNTILIRYKNGCIGGLGVNTEGELVNSVKIINGKRVNLSTAFSATEVLPVLFPTIKHLKECSENKYCSTCPLFALGNGFVLVVDDNNIYNIKNDNGYVHLPPLAKVQKHLR